MSPGTEVVQELLVNREAIGLDGLQGLDAGPGRGDGRPPEECCREEQQYDGEGYGAAARQVPPPRSYGTVHGEGFARVQVEGAQASG